jgi:uridine kinase
MISIEILYTETLNNAIKCKMDVSTIVNLREIHKHNQDNNFSWSGYEGLLNQLNGYYRSNI